MGFARVATTISWWGSERDWTAAEWSKYVTLAIRDAKTESDLDEIDGLVSLPDLHERVQAGRADLARVRRLKRKAEIETSLDKVITADQVQRLISEIRADFPELLDRAEQCIERAIDRATNNGGGAFESP